MIKKLLIALAILFYTSTSHAAALSADVCENGQGDGGGNCDYTSLDTAVSTEAQDLTDGGGDTFLFEIKGAWTAADSSISTSAR